MDLDVPEQHKVSNLEHEQSQAYIQQEWIWASLSSGLSMDEGRLSY
jgi:hypothetical protein